MKTSNEFLLSDKDYQRVVVLIHDSVGISLSESKKHLVYNRLANRLRANKLNSFDQYIDLLKDKKALEWEFFINALTTNLTSFFREAYHFEMLSQYIEEHLRSRLQGEPIKIWCSACSTGEEAYSIAMTMIDLFGTMTPPVKILATDLNTSVLSSARLGRYALDDVQKMTEIQQKKFFIPVNNEIDFYIRPEVKALISFKKLNLCDSTWPMTKMFDVIFCRNVMIYFDKNTQKKLLNKFSHYLLKEGKLFIGHSESLPRDNLHFKLNNKTMYERL